MLEEKEYNKLYLDGTLKKELYSIFKGLQKKCPFPLSSEDLYQETYLKVWKDRAEWNPDKGELREWIKSIAYTTSVNYIKSEQARLNRDTKYAGNPDMGVGEDGTPEALVECEQAQYEILGAVDQLPHELREVLKLKALEGLSDDEIGTKLGITQALVRKRLERARNRLRN